MKLHQKDVIHCRRGTTIGLAILLAGIVTAGTAKADTITDPSPDPITGSLLITSGSASTGLIALTPLDSTDLLLANLSLVDFNGWNLSSLGVTGGIVSGDIPVVSASGTLSCTSSSCPSDPLVISVSVTGITEPVIDFSHSASQTEVNTGGSAVRTQQAYWDASDTLFGTASPLPAISLSCPSPPNPSSCSSATDTIAAAAGPSPYSLTLVNTLTAAAGIDQFSGQVAGTPIAEPSTWSLLAMALGGFGWWRRKRVQRWGLHVV